MSALAGRIATGASAVLLALCGCPLPAVAAEPEPTIITRFQQLTLAPGTAGQEAILLARIESGDDAPGVASVRYTVDYSGIAAFTDVEIIETGAFGLGASLRSSGSVSSGPSAPAGAGCQTSGTKITCTIPVYTGRSLPWMGLAYFGVKPKAGAGIGDSGTVQVTAAVDDGPESSSESTVRIGEGVNLAALEPEVIEVTAGDAAEVDPRVRNAGSTVADGVVVFLGLNPDALGETSFSNCFYGGGVYCTFDTTLQPGATYRLAEPFTVRTPADAITGSEMYGGISWTTLTEWDDLRESFPAEAFGDLTAGTGAELTLAAVPEAAGAPQVETDYTNNGTDLTVVVTDGESADLAALGAKVSGKVDGEVAVRVGRVNNGPGHLYPELFENNILPVEVQLPPHTYPVNSDCWEKYDEAVVSCYSDDDLASGDRELFELVLMVEKKPGKAGAVRVADAGDNTDPANNTAALVVTVTGEDDGLPITGPGGLATAGLLLVGLGFIGRLLARRRHTTT